MSQDVLLGLRQRLAVVRALLDDATRSGLPADTLGIADDVGTVEVGKRADLVLFHGNPLDDPTIVADHDRVGLVMQNGRVVKQRG